MNHTHRLDPQESKPVKEYGLKELKGQSVYTATWYLWLRARVSERRWRHSQAMTSRGKHFFSHVCLAVNGKHESPLKAGRGLDRTLSRVKDGAWENLALEAAGRRL